MSIETQIAALVAASNSLTAAVSGKISEIDGKVLALQKSVPNTVRGMLSQVVYVDGLLGNDAAAGTAAAPLKTIDAALNIGLSGCVLTVLLACGQEYKITGYRSATNQYIVIRPYGNDTKPVISFSTDAQGTIGRIDLNSSSLRLQGVKIKHPFRNGVTSVLPDIISHACITAISSNVSFDYGQINGVNVNSEIDMGNDAKAIFVNAERSMSFMNINSTDITGTAGNVIKFRNNGMATLRVAATTKAAGVEFYPVASLKSNIDIISNA